MEITNDENLSDDEIFFGKMTLKEAKKIIFMNLPQRQTISYSAPSKPDEEESVKIIETHSEPDLIVIDNTLDSDLKSVSSPNIICNHAKTFDLDVKPDDSFIRLEKMVTELCMSPTDKNPQLDNTLEVVDFILNNTDQNKHEAKNNNILPCLNDMHLDIENKINNVSIYNTTAILNIGQTKHEANNNILSCLDDLNLDVDNNLKNISIGVDDIKNVETNILDIDNVQNNSIEHETDTLSMTPKNKTVEFPTEGALMIAKVESAPNIVNNKHHIKCEPDMLLATPKNKNHQPTSNNNILFKTPKNPVSSKKQISSSKKTPSRLNTYQHITSPVASYIKNTPQVPLLKEVHPQRPLPCKSFIPQPVKNVSKVMNKENIQFPAVAYKSAKKTQMVSLPSEEKMPKGEWTNKLTSTIKKPVVITHGHRVMNNVRNLNKRQEDSFANLSLQQADLSLCTKKPAC